MHSSGAHNGGYAYGERYHTQARILLVYKLRYLMVVTRVAPTLVAGKDKHNGGYAYGERYRKAGASVRERLQTWRRVLPKI